MRLHLAVIAATFLFTNLVFAGGPTQATLSCAEGLKNFPFLKPWVEKLGNFETPVESGNTNSSLFYTIGATVANRNASELWKKDSGVLYFDWKGNHSKLESRYLGAFSKINTVKSEWERLWRLLYSPSEMELLDSCSADDCKIKFDDLEVKQVASTPQKRRLQTFKEVIEQRINAYEKAGAIYLYEGNSKPLSWENMPISADVLEVFGKHFELPKDRRSFGYELFDGEPGHHKPVVGIFSRQCGQVGTGSKAFTECTDMVVYNNHYFDFWARKVLFFPWCGTQIALAYETVDVDQIKHSEVVRILFGSQMRELMGVLLETRLKRLHMLGF